MTLLRRVASPFSSPYYREQSRSTQGNVVVVVVVVGFRSRLKPKHLEAI